MSSGFITESEAVEVRKRKQEEWERVRKADDPIVRPEESYDPRSLYERLQEQKQKRDLDYEEAHKLKNMIKGLDDDEIEFLDLVDRKKTEADRIKELEEEQELLDYRNRVSLLQEKTIDDRLQAEIIVNKTKKDKQPNIQQKLMKGVVIKKPENQKRKINESRDQSLETSDLPSEPTRKRVSSNAGGASETFKEESVAAISPNTGLKCIAILPGIGCYEDSSSDENSSESDTDNNKSPNKMDLLGRKLEKNNANIEK